MNVLSLFDGMSVGQLALKELNVKVDNYFASEIDKYAIAVTKYNFPTTQHIGDIRDVNVSKLPKIDLLIGGSSCQQFSFAGKRSGMTTKTNIEITTLEQYLKLKDNNFEFEGQSYLFWEYMRILKDIQKYNPDVKFLLENVKMSKKWKSVLDEAIGVEGYFINSSLVSAQNRPRLYWCNWELSQPEDRNIILKDVLEDIEIENTKTGIGVLLSKTSNKQSECKCEGVATDIKGYEMIKRLYSVDGKCPTLTTCQGGHREPKIIIDKSVKPNIVYRKITPIEAERLQTLPDNYTKFGNFNGEIKEISKTQRYKMLGNGWTLEVIKHIFRQIKRIEK